MSTRTAVLKTAVSNYSTTPAQKLEARERVELCVSWVQPGPSVYKTAPFTAPAPSLRPTKPALKPAGFSFPLTYKHLSHPQRA